MKTSEDYTTQAAKMASYELSQMTGVFVGEKKVKVRLNGYKSLD